MRAAPTEAERALWRLLRAKRLLGWKWKRQQPIGRYIVDFVCFEARLIVEADGSHHIEREYDGRRDAWLRQQGFDLLRFWNSDILARPDAVLESILSMLRGESSASATPLPGPLPQGEREKKDGNA